MKINFSFFVGVAAALILTACTNTSNSGNSTPSLNVNASTAYASPSGAGNPITVTLASSFTSQTNFVIGATDNTPITNIQVTGLPSGVTATYSAACSSLSSGQTCSIQFQGNGSATPGTYPISITSSNASPVNMNLVVQWPTLSLNSTSITNPNPPGLVITLSNTSNVLVHLGTFSLSNLSPNLTWGLATNAGPTPCSALPGNVLNPSGSPTNSTCTFTVTPPDNLAGDSATINIAGTELQSTFQATTQTPTPALTITPPSSDDPIILTDGYSGDITVQNTNANISVPNITYALDNPAFATDGTNRFTVTNNCSGNLNSSSSCTINMAFSTSTANIAGHSTTLRVSANSIQQSPAVDVAVSGLIFSSSHASDQYAAYDKLLITNGATPSVPVTLQSFNLTGTDVDDTGFPSSASGTDPDSGTVCANGLVLNASDQCHLWLHASATAPTATANNFNLAITYAVNGVTQPVKNLTGTNRTVVYAGGTQNGAAYVRQWDGSSWSNIGGSTGGAFITNALVTDPNGNLYAGGQFNMINGGTTVNYIAEWNGNTWLPIGNSANPGVNGYVNSLAYNANKLYAGGAFTATTDGTSASKIVQWDGSNWSALSGNNVATGNNDFVYALSPYQTSSLFAGGTFTANGFNRIAKWDLSSTWSNVANGVNGNVWSIAAIGADAAYVGGEFTQTISPTQAVNQIALYQNGALVPLFGGGASANSTVYALQVDASNNLYAAGSFTTIGGVLNTSDIGKFTPSGSPGFGTWSSVSNGLQGPVYSMAQDPSGNLYVGGTFATAGLFTFANNIAVWNGTSWSALGLGITGSSVQVRAIAVGSVVNLSVGS